MDFYDSILRYSERAAIITEDGTEITYKELAETADEIAAPVAARSLVFLVCENCFEAIAAYVGFLRKRAVTALVNPKIDGDMLRRLLESYKPQYIFCPRGWRDCGEEAAAFGAYHLLRTQNSAPPAMNPELAVLITTSGSIYMRATSW